ncbi:MAG: hypothetical protein HOI95_18835, partial [Chromatiales bacterium]|nr:hypothetical protein [Chromatiales bacterium]
MRQGCIIAALFGLVGVVYWPGLEGPFIGDDFPNFVGNPFVHIHALTLEQLLQAASSNRSGPFGRPIAAVTFALNYLGAGTFDQFSFKLTNVVIHLVNTLLVYFLARALVRASSATTATLGHTSLPGRENIPWVAIVVTAIWALHPLQLTNILYGVQRMNSLACLVTLTGVLVFMVGRKRLSEGRAGGWRYTIGGVVAGTVLGVFAKENAIVLPGLAFVIELTVFRGLAAGHTLRPKLLTFYSVVLFIPAVIGTVLIVFTFDILSHGYALREFDLMQRLLTQCRVLFWFVSQTFLPDAQQMSLFHDDFPVSQSLLEPMSTLWSVFGWCVVIALCVALRRRLPWLGFAVGWFLIGHSLEGSFLP